MGVAVYNHIRHRDMLVEGPVDEEGGNMGFVEVGAVVVHYISPGYSAVRARVRADLDAFDVSEHENEHEREVKGC